MLIIVLLALFQLSLSIEYNKGEKFAYDFTSQVVTVSQGNDGQKTGLRSNAHQSTQEINTTAEFRVLLTSSVGSFLEMKVSNLRIKMSSEEVCKDSSDVEPGEQLDALFGNPVYFTHKQDGSILDVSISNDEDDSITAIKMGVLNSLRTVEGDGKTDKYQSSVLDAHGRHIERFQLEKKAGGEMLISSSYNQDDFNNFADPAIDPTQIQLSSQNRRLINNERITSSEQSQTVTLNPKNRRQSNDDTEVIDPIPEFFIVSDGISKLNNKRTLSSNDDEQEFPYSSVEEFMRQNQNLKLVNYLQNSFYEERERIKKQQSRFTQLSEKRQQNDMSCTPELTACYSYKNSWQVGGNDFGLRLTASAAVGMMKGCSLNTSSSYLAGADVKLEGLILGKTVTAADAFAEYGEINGVAKRNQVKVDVIGKNIFSKSFSTYKACSKQSLSVSRYEKDWSFGFTILVVIVPVTFSAGLKVEFNAEAAMFPCVQQVLYNVSFIPSVKLTAYGGASVSIIVAKAGVNIEGSFTQSLDPHGYVDGARCALGYEVNSVTDPLTAKLYGWYRVRKWTLSWGKEHKVTIWSNSLARVTKNIDRREARVY